MLERPCPHCESQITFDAAICRFCGSEVPLPYAKPWKRILAYVVDKTLLVLVQTGILYLLAMAFGFLNPKLDLEILNIEKHVALFKLMMLIWIVTGFTIAWLYFAIFESSSLKGTPGKLLLGIKVTDNWGERISFGRASLRFVVKLLTFGTGFLTCFLNDRKQALYDMIANTFVLKRT